MFFYIVITLLVLVYFVSTRKYGYFKKKKLPHLKPTFLVGNYGDFILRHKSMAKTLEDICNKFPNEKLIGAYYGTEPALVPKDPDLIKLIMTKDFYYFNGRDLTAHNHKTPISLNLAGTFGDRWKVLRQNMTPLFSSAKMKNMFHLIEKCSHVYETMLDKEVTISPDKIEVRGMLAKFTIECIVACAFGLDANTMTDSDPKKNAFAKIANLTFGDPRASFYIRLLRSIWPSIFYGLGLNILETQINFFKNLIISVMEKRDYKASGRHDFVDLVLSWKLNNHIVGDSIKSVKDGEAHKVTLPVTDDLLTAQCFIFFNAGFETSSTTLSYTLFELAKHQSIQNKVLEEVDAYLTRHNNKLEYECISELPYLEACIDETLRLYPILGVITREQMEDYTFPNGVFIEKGKRIHIPVSYLHHNPEYYPNPEEFRPERFLGEEKKKIVPYTYMPFGEGPRTCIGMRFARMQMMAGLITMLKKYRLELADGVSTTLKFKPESLLTHPVGGIDLKFIAREGWEKRVFVKDN